MSGYPETALQALLNEGVAFDPHYVPSMNSDHLPMTLCAIAGLGGDVARLHEYRDDYARILRPVVSGATVSDWRSGIGKADTYLSLLGLFTDQISRTNREAVVREVLPHVLTGVPMQAFHPLIRLGYALDFGSDAETAASLAYQVSSHTDLPVSSERIDIHAAFAAQVGQQPVKFSTQRFAGGILELVEQGAYPMGSASIADGANASLKIYRATRNFFALHMVTASQAMRICVGVLDEQDRLAAESALTGSLLAAHLVVGAPAFSEPAPMPRQIDREHGYKYAWVCLSEYRHYGHEVYREELEAMVAAGLLESWVLTNL